MPESVTVYLPSLLHHCADGAREVTVQGETLASAVENLLREYPKLRTHIYESDGTQREHVLLFYNDENTKYLDSLDIPLQPGDTISITQAVSGG